MSYGPGTHRERDAPMRSEEIEEALARTRDRDARERRMALLDLCPCRVRADIPSVWGRLIEMRADPEASVRSLVLHALCDGSPRSREREVVQAVEAMANDPDRRLRRRARAALAQYARTGRINLD